MHSPRVLTFRDLAQSNPSVETPLICAIDTFLSYDWERDILTVILKDPTQASAIGIFQNKIGAMIFWARLWKEFPLPICIMRTSTFHGAQLILDIQEAIINPYHLIKVSSINAWSYCEARVYATEVFGLKNAPSDNLLRGSIIHDFLARVFTPEGLEGVRGPNWEATQQSLLLRATLDSWTTTAILGWDEDNLFKELRTQFLPLQQEYIRDYLQNLPQDLQLETETNVFSFHFGLKGRVDRLEISPRGHSKIIETKTGRISQKTIHAAENQALAYYIALRDVRHLEVEKLIIEFPLEEKNCRIVEKIIDPASVPDIINVRNRIYCQLHGLQPPVLERDMCSSCFSVETCQFLCFLRQNYATLQQCGTCKRYCIIKDGINRSPPLINRLLLYQQYYLYFINNIRISERRTQELREILNLSVDDRQSKGNCLAGLSLEGFENESGGTIFHITLNNPNSNSGNVFRPGDYVFISRENETNVENNAIRGVVRLVMDDVIHIFAPGLQEIPPGFQINRDFIVLDSVPQEIVEVREKEGLDWLIRGSFYPHLKELGTLRDVILFQRVPQQRKTLPPTIESEISPSKFDESQNAAIRGALRAKDVYCIQGPPGTGKTTVICEIIRLIVKEFRESEVNQGYQYEHRGDLSNQGMLEVQNINLRHKFSHHRTPVLVSAFTNRAVDNIVSKLSQDYADIKVIRLGNVHSIQDPVVKDLALEVLASKEFRFPDGTSERLPSPHLTQLILNAIDVVAVTSTSAGNPLCQQMCFHVAIIDEAGQITEPSTLIPATLAEKVILVGDQLQLPPVVEISEPPELTPQASRLLKKIQIHPHKGYTISLFERLMQNWHGTEYSSLLRFQYRMNEAIAQIASELFYEGQIQTGGGDPIAKQHIGQFLAPDIFDISSTSSIDQRIFSPELPLIFLDTRLTGAQDSQTTLISGPHSRFNSIEARIIANLCIGTLIRHYHGTTEGLRKILSGIGIITTYRAQVREITNQIERCIKKHLKLSREEVVLLLNHLEIDTVDRFQGREKEIVIISFVDSNPTGSISHLTAETRRFNVALTRAKKKVIIVGNSDTLSQLRQSFRPKIIAAKKVFQHMIMRLQQQKAFMELSNNLEELV